MGQTHRWRGSLGYTLTHRRSPRLTSARGPGVGQGRLPRAQAVLVGASRSGGGRGRRFTARSASGDCARSLPGGSGPGTGLSVCGPLLCCQRPLEVPATLSARRPDARSQPAEGGARGRGGARSGAGPARAGRGEGCWQPGTLPPLYLSPVPHDRRRGRELLEDNGSPLSPPPGCGFSQEAKPPRALSGTKKSGGVFSSKRWPRSDAARAVLGGQ